MMLTHKVKRARLKIRTHFYQQKNCSSISIEITEHNDQSIMLLILALWYTVTTIMIISSISLFRSSFGPNILNCRMQLSRPFKNGQRNHCPTFLIFQMNNSVFHQIAQLRPTPNRKFLRRVTVVNRNNPCCFITNVLVFFASKQQRRLTVAIF
ncbi:hypothetical protein T08_13395 [Trichinella sp. T8]|nr:hypothetical protein T08_13395 [Trichinella sp. T8]